MRTGPKGRNITDVPVKQSVPPFVLHLDGLLIRKSDRHN